MPEPTNPIAATKASVPALHANSQSAACVLGTAPIASATNVEVGFTAYGCELRPDPHRAQFGRINLGALHGVARGFNGHRDDIFVKSGDGFLFDGKSAFAASPYARDFLGGQTITRHVRAIANDANGFGRFEEGGEGLMLRSCHFIYFFLKAMGDI